MVVYVACLGPNTRNTIFSLLSFLTLAADVVLGFIESLAKYIFRILSQILLQVNKRLKN